MQFHLGILLFLPICIVFLIWVKKRIPWKHYLIAGSIAIVPLLPYCILDGLKGFENTQSIFQQGSQYYWEPESLKVISDPLFIGSIEISRLLSQPEFLEIERFPTSAELGKFDKPNETVFQIFLYI
jgi:hypothetical protein